MEGEKKNRIKEVIQLNALAVLSTVTSEGASESAAVEISVLDNLELIFDTLASFRKYRNLATNRNVSVVIGLEPVTIQYEGTAFELEGKELNDYKKIHLDRFPEAAKFEKLGMKFFKVLPKWIRYTDAVKQPWEVFEVNFMWARE
ncbi:MAG: pyridoxamine 5'-phosphate oxidase family protein [bacterium]|nr:pyridoxamine 5'-phosphate oxidase family protein [bacterium]